MGYKVEEKLYLGVLEQKRLDTTTLDTGSVVKYPPSSRSRPIYVIV
jgi:hypothetical protein